MKYSAILGSTLLLYCGENLMAQAFRAGQDKDLPASIIAPSDSTVKTGVLNEKGPDVVLKTKSGDFTLANGKAVLDAVKEKSFPVHLETVKLKGAGPYYLKATGFTPLSVGQWNEIAEPSVPGSDKPKLAEVSQGLLRLAATTKENITRVPAEQDWTKVLENYRSTREAIAKSFASVKDSPTRGRLALLKAHLATEEKQFFANKRVNVTTSAEADQFAKTLPVVQKRFYGLNDNYRPEIYPLMTARCVSSVAIVKKVGGSVPLGTGVIIGDDLVLTCAHNVPKGSAEEFDTSERVVWTDYEERRFAGPAGSPANVICECREVYRSSVLDFVLLKIRRADNKSAVGLPKVALNSNRVPRWTPIFLVGYPQGNRRTVHDSSWVLFPHQLINNEEWGEIESAVTEEYLSEVSGDSEEVKVERAANKARIFMEDRYGQFDPGDNTKYVLKRDGAEYIGAECDTFRGDSGAPAMLREDGTLIGILFQGANDGGADANTDVRNPRISSRPGAQYHERLVPIRLIMSDLDDGLKPWRTTLGITVQ